MIPPVLTATDLVIGATLVVLNACLSAALSLGLARTILVSGVRATLQLLLVGFVLRGVFSLQSAWAVVAVLAVMSAAAAHEIAGRQELSLRRPWDYLLGGGVMVVATTVVVAYGLATHIRPEPWYEPRYIIPLVGIVLGSVMSGISVGLNALTIGLSRERLAVETRLALGATRFEATKPLVRSAIRSGLIPILNQMAAAGLITLPGMMTGQILAGMSPDAAARYQILILFLLAGASGFGVTASVLAAVLRLTDDRHRLRLDRLAGS